MSRIQDRQEKMTLPLDGQNLLVCLDTEDDMDLKIPHSSVSLCLSIEK